MAKKKAKQASGGKRLMESGKKPVSFGVLPADWQFLVEAAWAERLPLTRFLITAGLEKAEKILDKKRPSP